MACLATRAASCAASLRPSTPSWTEVHISGKSKNGSVFRGNRKTDFIFRKNAKNGSDSHEKRNRNALFMQFLTSRTSRMRKTDFIFRQYRKTDFIFRQNVKNGSHFPATWENRIRCYEKRKAVAIPCKSPWLRPVEWSHVMALSFHMEQAATAQSQPWLLGWPLKPPPSLRDALAS